LALCYCAAVADGWVPRQGEDVSGVNDDLPTVIERAAPAIVAEIRDEHGVRPLALLINDVRFQWSR
jgi:hypothetical protein